MTPITQNAIRCFKDGEGRMARVAALFGSEEGEDGRKKRASGERERKEREKATFNLNTTNIHYAPTSKFLLSTVASTSNKGRTSVGKWLAQFTAGGITRGRSSALKGNSPLGR